MCQNAIDSNEPHGASSTALRAAAELYVAQGYASASAQVTFDVATGKKKLLPQKEWQQTTI